MKLLKAAILSSYRPKKDRSISITFTTQELTPNEIAEVHTMLDTFGYLMYKVQETLTKDEIQELDNLDTDLYDQPKSQSQRIRNVLYMNWLQDNLGHSEFKDYYKYQTEKYIEHFKNKLEQA